MTNKLHKLSLSFIICCALSAVAANMTWAQLQPQPKPKPKPSGNIFVPPAQQPAQLVNPSLLAEKILVPAPQLTNWGPTDKAYPGMILAFEGTNLDYNNFRVQITNPANNASVRFPIKTATSRRIEVAVLDTAYTGPAGLPLSISYFGGQSRVLNANFKIIDRETRFLGESLWHETGDATSNIFTKGSVALALDKLEFAANGVGTYMENVSLIGLLKRYTRPCTNDVGFPGQSTYEDWGWVQRRINRNIKWARLSDGRIELQKIGTSGDGGYSVTVAASVNSQLLRVKFNGELGGSMTAPMSRQRTNGCMYGLGQLPPPIPEAQDFGVLEGPGPLIEWALARK